MLKYVSKFALDILPSVVATIIGAYIVNHYINAKPAEAPVAAAVSTTDPKAVAKVAPVRAKAEAKTDIKTDIKADPKASEAPSDVASLPEAGVKARGISERALLEKSAAEMPITPVEKPADKPVDTASIPVDTRRRPVAPREKTAVRVVLPSPVQPAADAPAVVAPNPAPPVQATVAPEEHRDANDLARAAIERLRGSSDGSPRPQEASRIPDAPRAAPAVRPLPPPITVSTPSSETSAAPARVDDPRRPTPPADIPYSPPPLDLRADATEPMPREHRTVAEDVLSAAKSVFRAVIPR